MRPRRATTVTGLTTASLLTGAILLTGCGGPGGDGGGGAASSGAADSVAAPGPAKARSATGQSGGAEGGSRTNTSARVVPLTRSVVFHGEITVRVKSVASAVARAEAFAAGAGGLVTAEETTSGAGSIGATNATMTLKVPPTEFRPVLNQLGGLGKALSRSQTAEDVTSQTVDVESRLRSQRGSVARLQALLDKATSIGAVVAVEGELARREADLEALEAHQKELAELVDLATIRVEFVAPHVSPAPVDTDTVGFLYGLRAGLAALVSVVLVTLTVGGALLPFLITLALLGVPTWLVLRARRRAVFSAPVPAASDS